MTLIYTNKQEKSGMLSDEISPKEANKLIGYAGKNSRTCAKQRKSSSQLLGCDERGK
jgi:hypothetical protein